MKTIFEQIDIDLRNAIYSKDEILLTTIRAIKTKLVEVAKSKEGNGRVSDENAIVALKSMIKQRKQSAETYMENQRPELAKIEELEIAIIEKYIPSQMSMPEIRKEILIAIGELNLTELKQLGQLIKHLAEKLKGKVDNKQLSELAKQTLQAYENHLKSK